MVTEASTEYIWNHIESLFPSNPPPVFQVKIGLDSECVLWTLHPENPPEVYLNQERSQCLCTHLFKHEEIF